MAEAEPRKAEKTGPGAKARAGWRGWVARLTAGLTHTTFVLAVILAFAGGAIVGDAGTTGSIGRLPQAQPPRDADMMVYPAAARRKQRKPEPASPQEPHAQQPVSQKEQGRRSALMDRLVAAYPDQLKGHRGNDLIWRDGTRMTFDDGRAKDFQARLANADIEDQFAAPYPMGEMLSDPEPDSDPGRFRNQEFFLKMYGDCRKGDVRKKLAEVVWLPKHGGSKIKITSVNGVAEKLQAVSNELDTLPDDMMRYLKPIAGTYNCRKIAGTRRLSGHAYGFAIDINGKFGDYWRWHKGRYRYRNRVPWAIAAIFEKHGFIWGAKWYHYDTLHFEYRPELLKEETGTVNADAPVPLPEKQPRKLD